MQRSIQFIEKKSNISEYLEKQKFSKEQIQLLLENEEYNLRVVKKRGQVNRRKLPLVLKKEDVDKYIDCITYNLHKTMFRIMADCGLRVSEVCNLKIEDINLEQREIKVVEGKGMKDRLVPIPSTSQLNTLLPVIIGLRTSGYLFCHFYKGIERPYHTRSIEDYTSNYAIKAGLDPMIHPHTFRHSYASYLAENDVSLEVIRDNLGHASLLSTNIYLHTQTRYRKSAVDKIQF